MLEVDGDDRRIAFHRSLNFDATFPHYGTRNGVLPHSDPLVATSSPVMWAEALDHFMRAIADEDDLDLSRLRAVTGAGQQHGSVYLASEAGARLGALDPGRPLAEQVGDVLSRAVAPIWMDSSTSAECVDIAEALGGHDAVHRLTGSQPTERFTGPQIRKFHSAEPTGYAATDRIHLVSSFLASLLVGQHAAIDHGDGSGMNLMDLGARAWSDAALQATAPNLRQKLPPLTAPWSTVGRLTNYWRERYGLPPARVIAWTGDNPSSLIGVGLVDDTRMAVSLGTSDTVFGILSPGHGDPPLTSNVFATPTGDDMALICFKNGALARERIRDAYGMEWDGFSRALEATPPGNGGRVMLPWFEAEITPPAPAGVRRFGFDDSDAAANVRAVVEAQMTAIARHSAWMGRGAKAIHATGGAAQSRAILQVMADVHDADVYRLETTDSAALGAALRAWHGDRLADGQPVSWQDVVRGIAEPSTVERIRPNPRHVSVYAGFKEVHAACEASAREQGGDPSVAIERFRNDHGN